MFSIDYIHKLARQNKIVLGLGVNKKDIAIRKTIRYTKNQRFIKEIIIFNEPNLLVKSLKSGIIDCAIRGNLEATSTIIELKKQFDLNNIFRAAILKPSIEKSLLMLAPVGVDEGRNINEKFELSKYCTELIEMFKSKPKLGILSGGRNEDINRNNMVKENIRDAIRLLELTRAIGICTDFYGIEIEKAVKYKNCIIAPDGISGNFIFRSLHYLGGWEALGAPILNLMKHSKIFIDTSRGKSDFCEAIALASAMNILLRK